METLSYCKYILYSSAGEFNFCYIQDLSLFSFLILGVVQAIRPDPRGAAWGSVSAALQLQLHSEDRYRLG